MDMSMIVLVVVIVALLVTVPVVAGVFYALRVRGLEHLERMRAIELGQSLPGEGEDCTWTPAKLCLAIGLGVPVGVFGVVWLASQAAHVGSEAWQAAGFVGVAGVVCGTVLALRLPGSRNRQTFSNVANSKPVQDPDTYDVAGQRG